jgi:hypothetical protein
VDFRVIRGVFWGQAHVQELGSVDRRLALCRDRHRCQLLRAKAKAHGDCSGCVPHSANSVILTENSEAITVTVQASSTKRFLPVIPQGQTELKREANASAVEVAASLPGGWRISSPFHCREPSGSFCVRLPMHFRNSLSSTRQQTRQEKQRCPPAVLGWIHCGDS